MNSVNDTDVPLGALANAFEIGRNLNRLRWNMARSAVIGDESGQATLDIDALDLGALQAFPLDQNHPLRNAIREARLGWCECFGDEAASEEWHEAWGEADEQDLDGETLFDKLLRVIPACVSTIDQAIESAFKPYPKMLAAYWFGVRVDEGCRPKVQWSHFLRKLSRKRCGRRVYDRSLMRAWSPVNRKPGEIAPDANWSREIRIRWRLLNISLSPPAMPKRRIAAQARLRSVNSIAKAALDGLNQLDFAFDTTAQNDSLPPTTCWEFRKDEFAFGGSGYLTLTGDLHELLELIAKRLRRPTSRALLDKFWPGEDKVIGLKRLRNLKSRLNDELQSLFNLDTKLEVVVKRGRGEQAIWMINPDLGNLFPTKQHDQQD